MLNKNYFSASLMCIDWLNVKNDLDILERINMDYIHYDILDGSFAPDFTMGSSIINKVKNYTSLPSDYHLMVEEPKRIFDIFDFSNNDIVTLHQECCKNLHRDIIHLKKKGVKVGVAISPGTNIEVLEYIIDDIDIVLLMTVNPGFMGQDLVGQVISKISNTRKLINEHKKDIIIAVDGNVNSKNINNMSSAGANFFVLGSSGLFRNDISIEESFKKTISQIFK